MAVPARHLEDLPRWRPADGTLRPRPGARSPARRTPPAARPRAPARRTPFVLFAGTVVTAMVLFLASAQVMVAQSSFQISALQDRVQRLGEEHGRLRVEAARLGAPERIMRAARKAGLVLPREVEILAVRGRGAERIRSHLGTLAGPDLGGAG